LCLKLVQSGRRYSFRPAPSKFREVGDEAGKSVRLFAVPL
jgi:hypothetical protein